MLNVEQLTILLVAGALGGIRAAAIAGVAITLTRGVVAVAQRRREKKARKAAAERWRTAS